MKKIEYDFESDEKENISYNLDAIFCDLCKNSKPCINDYGNRVCEMYKKAEQLLNEEIFDRPEKQSQKPEFKDINIMLDIIQARLDDIEKKIEILSEIIKHESGTARIQLLRENKLIPIPPHLK